jgi:hypothetical protein
VATREERTLAVVERVVAAMSSHGAPTALIGAAAAAVHKFVRATEDIDLASYVDPYTTLALVQKELVAEGFAVKLSEPDAQDALGGVLTISGGEFDPVQVVNFFNPWGGGTALGREAIESAISGPLSFVPVVDLAHLIALKLYAGGPKARNDVAELMERNPDADRKEIVTVCERYALGDAFRAIVSAK